jgi:UDP-N-acetyl-D-mannosaminuronate dehydrogenase
MQINFLKKKIIKKKFILGVIGLGYVGLPIANRFIKEGIKVFALEQDLEKVKKLKKGINYIKNKSLKNFNYFKNNKKNVSNKYSILKNCDVILVCLPTP